MSVETTPRQSNVTHTNIVVVGNDAFNRNADHFGQLIDHELDVRGIDRANFVLPEDDGVSHVVLTYVQREDNPHTAERCPHTPAEPQYALPLGQHAFIFEARAAAQRGLSRYSEWEEAAERFLGEESVGGWVTKT